MIACANGFAEGDGVWRFLQSIAGLRIDSDADEAAVYAEAREESELARRVFNGPESFTPLYERYYTRIVQYLYRRTGNSETAHDLAATTFLNAFDALRRREQRVNFRPWLYRIATNAFISHARSSRTAFVRAVRFAGELLRRQPTHARDIADAAERRRRVRAALDKLPERYRAALVLRFDEELGYEEIAEVLGVAVTGARTRVSRGLVMLEQRLQRFADGGL